MPEAPEASTALKLWVVMNRALRPIEERLEQQVEAHGLSFTEFAVLEVLLHKGPLPIGKIGSLILLTSGSMTYVIDKLARRGLIERKACETDRRVVHAELTKQGRSLMEEVFPAHAALIRDLMGGLQPDEQEDAINLLKRLGRYAEKFATPEAGTETA